MGKVAEKPVSSAEPETSFAGKTVAILGAGKVGCAAGALLRETDLRVVAVTTRHAETAAIAAEFTGAKPGTSNAWAASKADIVLITTNDDAIADVAAEIAELGAVGPGQLVVHMSGALQLFVLSPAEQAGAHIGAAHSMQSFASREQAIRDMPGSVFGITAGPNAREELVRLVFALHGRPVDIPDEKKPLYHAAAVVASNYFVALQDMAAELLVTAGFDETSAIRALAPLTHGTFGNMSTLGTTKALTGPIVRGDIESVRRHLDALADLPPDRLQLYRTLGLRTLRIARRRNTLDLETLAELEELLGGEGEQRA